MKKAITILCVAIVAALCVGLFAGCKPPEFDWWKDGGDDVYFIIADEEWEESIILLRGDPNPEIYYEYDGISTAKYPKVTLMYKDEIKAEGRMGKYENIAHLKSYCTYYFNWTGMVGSDYSLRLTVNITE